MRRSDSNPGLPDGRPRCEPDNHAHFDFIDVGTYSNEPKIYNTSSEKYFLYGSPEENEYIVRLEKNIKKERKNIIHKAPNL